MEQHILVALDESPWADAAAGTAIALAAADPDATLLIGVHVVGVTHLSGDLIRDLAGLLGFEPVLVPEHVELVYRRQGRRVLDTFEARCAEAGVRCRTILETGAVLGRLVHHASSADLVVMGALGASETQSPGQGGSLADRFVKASPTSVLCTGRQAVEFNGVTIGYDGSEGARCAVKAVRHLLRGRDTPVRVVYVVDERRGPDFDPLPEGAQALSSERTVETARLVGEAHEALASDCETSGHDLLALGYRGRSFVGELLLGRVTERVLGKARMAVLVAR
ncbi:MAG: universal stress protein [Proteobacteria bacterium]|nr:universal stress protein [Pseudomonadota bacterium]MCP4919309.1 universal stress protein [Pseudomonadota bacterium]